MKVIENKPSFSSRMTIKLVRIDTFDDLLLPTNSCDLLIFWACELLKILNLQFQELHDNRSYMITKRGEMLPTDSSDLLIFWLRENFKCPIEAQNFFKGTLENF